MSNVVRVGTVTNMAGKPVSYTTTLTFDEDELALIVEAAGDLETACVGVVRSEQPGDYTHNEAVANYAKLHAARGLFDKVRLAQQQTQARKADDARKGAA